MTTNTPGHWLDTSEPDAKAKAAYRLLTFANLQQPFLLAGDLCQSMLKRPPGMAPFSWRFAALAQLNFCTLCEIAMNISLTPSVVLPTVLSNCKH